MYQKILLPTDGSEQSEKPIRVAIDLAKMTGASITVMYAYSPLSIFRKRGTSVVDELKLSLEEEGAEIVTEAATKIKEAGLTVSALVVEGPPAEAILKAIEEEQPDLIVMGSRGTGTGIGSLRLGSTVDRVVQHSEVSVLVVK